MSIKMAVKAFLKKAGFRLYRERLLPRGIEPFRDLADLVGCERLRTAIDIGANVGQTVATMLEELPLLDTIVAVEPASDSYASLARRFGADPRLKLLRCALGSRIGSGQLVCVASHSQQNYLRQDEGSSGIRDAGVETETVEISTLTELVNSSGLARIDLVKIDAEGHDLEVLKGATPLLEHSRIGAILVEVCFDPGDRSHAHFDDIHPLLVSSGFTCLGFYDVHHVPMRMHYGNALYLNPQYFADGRH